jgi:hypothetical protein
MGLREKLSCCWSGSTERLRHVLRRASRCVRAVPLPRPLPVRSSRRGEYGAARIGARRQGSNCVRGAPPYSPRLAPPPKTPGGGGLRSRFEGASHLPPPRCLWGRAGEGGGPPSRTDPAEAHRPLPYVNLPRQFRGRWAGGAGPEGACAELSGAPHPLPHTQPPPVFLGEVGGWCPPGGGAPDAAIRLKRSKRLCDVYPPSRAVCGRGWRALRRRRGRAPRRAPSAPGR